MRLRLRGFGIIFIIISLFYYLFISIAKIVTTTEKKYFRKESMFLRKYKCLIQFIIAPQFRKFQNRKLNKSKHKELSMTIIYLLFLYFIAHAYASVSYRSFTSPNYRNISALPSNTTEFCWIMKIVEPENWTYIQPVAFPMIADGETGISVDFQLPQTGLYKIRLILNTSLLEQTEIIWQSNSSYYSMYHNLSHSLFIDLYLPENLTTRSKNFYIWLDSGLIVNSIQILFELPVGIQLSYSPSTLTLNITTDIPITDLKNVTEMLELMFVELKYKQNLTDQCLKSNGSTTNPAHWTLYNSTTDYGNETAGYNYSLLNDLNASNNVTNLPSYFAFQVQNIKIDCSVNILIQFPEGNFLSNNNFTTIFLQHINQTLNNNQKILTVSPTLIYIYSIKSQRLFIHVIGISFYNHTDLNILDTVGGVTIDGAVCRMDRLIYVKVNYGVFVCVNTTQLLWTSVLRTNFRNDYFRDSLTNSLIRFNITQTNRKQYTIDTYISVNVTYEQETHKIIYIYPIAVQNNWRQNVTSNSTNIFINGVKVSWYNINVTISNDNNSIIAETILGSPLLVSDTVTIFFDSFWSRFKTLEGYLNFWIVKQNFKITRIPGPPAPASSTPIPPTPTPPQQQQQKQQQNTKKSWVFQKGRLPLAIIQYAQAGWNLFVFGYFINNFIAFQNLVFLYYFVGFKNVVNIYRKDLAEIIILINQQTDCEQIMNILFNSNITLTIITPQSNNFNNITPKYSALNFKESQYNSDFLQSCFQSLLLIVLIFIKLAIIKGLMIVIPCHVMKDRLGKVYHYRILLVLFEILLAAPQVYVVFGIWMRPQFQMGFPYFIYKLNFLLMLMMGCASFSAFLMIIYAKLKSIKVKISSSKSLLSQKDHSQGNKNINNTKNNHQILHLLDNFLYILVPFLVGTDNSSIFIPCMTFLITFRLAYVIKKKSTFQCGIFLKELINKTLWFLFNLVYLFYWLTQMLQIDCNQGIWPKILTWCDIAESCLLLGGCIFEMAVNFIKILVSIAAIIKNLLVKTKIESISQSKLPSSQTKKTVIVQNYPQTLESQPPATIQLRTKPPPKQIYKLATFYQPTINTTTKTDKFITISQQTKIKVKRQHTRQLKTLQRQQIKKI